MRTVAAALVGAVLLMIALAAAPTAAAHATRIATDPAVDAVLDSGPSRVSATFNEQVQTTFAAMTVVGPDGNLWSTGQPRVQGAIVSVDLMPLGPAGTYTVNYRVTSADGHVVSGSWPFRVTTPGTGKPGPPAATPGGSGGGIAMWPFVAIAAIAAIVIGGGGWWAFRRTRH
jgi:methionine-rich copper-binding protein CopC